MHVCMFLYLSIIVSFCLLWIDWQADPLSALCRQQAVHIIDSSHCMLTNADEEKVQALMKSIQEIGLHEPIDVLEVEGNYYGFSGCHRFEVRRQEDQAQLHLKTAHTTTLTGRGTQQICTFVEISYQFDFCHVAGPMM